jgi:hypothetical protein
VKASSGLWAELIHQKYANGHAMLTKQPIDVDPRERMLTHLTSVRQERRLKCPIGPNSTNHSSICRGLGWSVASRLPFEVNFQDRSSAQYCRIGSGKLDGFTVNTKRQGDVVPSSAGGRLLFQRCAVGLRRWSRNLKWIARSIALPLMTASLLQPASAESGQVDRQGVGYWCYDPVRSPTLNEKNSFVEEVSLAAVSAERKWGVPAPVLAAMTIVESGYGFTRLAIKSNNILAFKWPGMAIAAGRQEFVLWCQPPEDRGNVYPSFESRTDAIDFVASRLKLASHYQDATATYVDDMKNGVDRKSAAQKWLRAIAPKYNWKPERYVRDVSRMADDPLGDGSRTLWSLEP